MLFRFSCIISGLVLGVATNQCSAVFSGPKSTIETPEQSMKSVPS